MKKHIQVSCYERGRRRLLDVPGREVGWEQRRQGRELLVLPSAAARWSKSDPRWRSVHLRSGAGAHHKVLSLGLPKFWDPQDSPQNVAALEKAAAAGQLPHASVKYDGQQLVRFVCSGQVCWRTRTSFTIDDSLRAPAQALFDLYPRLADPCFAPTTSLQFELCLRRQRIVVAYDHDFLVLVGASDNQSLQVLPWGEICDLGRECKVAVADTLPLNGSRLDEWQRQIEAWGAGVVGEGVVLRDDTGMPRLRLKTQAYQGAFRRRFTYPPGAIYRALTRESARARNSTPELVTSAVVRALDVAGEEQAYAAESIAAFLEVERRSRERVRELASLVAAARAESGRGVFAREVASTHPLPEGPALLKLWDEDETGALQALIAYAVNRLCEELDRASVLAGPSPPVRTAAKDR